MKYNFCVISEKKQRVDMYISALFGEFSRSYIQKIIDSGCVMVNGEAVKKNLKISHGDEIEIQEIISSTNINPENIPLDIIYEDENICVINKDAGINVHPTPGVEGKSGTLVNALLHHCKEQLPIISGEERPGIVHRLDKDTSGVIITAKNDLYMRDISEKIKARNVKKYYIAIVAGVFPDKVFTINSDIGRHPSDKIKMTTRNPLNPKHAITHGEVLGYINEKYSVLKIELETGRTHQIRVHLAELGYPIVGDSVYGDMRVNHDISKIFGIHRQMLHSYMYQLPLYNQQKTFFAECKDDMKKLLSFGKIEV